MAIELAVGYVTILPEVSKLGPTLKRALGDADSQFGDAGKSAGGRFSGALSTAIGTMGGMLAAKAAGAVGGLIGTAITKGFTRYTQIENANQKLLALGNSAADVSKIMAGANKAVKGTAFGMGEAADVAAAAVASGIKPGEQLDSTLRTIANAASIAGMDMSSMGAIFNKAAASGKVQGDILAQLGDNGVPAVQWLAKEMGVTAEEVYKLGSAGKINFDTFQRAMANGMDPNAAVMMGNTLSGMWANSQEALGRLGAKVLETFGPMITNALRGSIGSIDAMTNAVGPAMGKLRDLGVQFGQVWAGNTDGAPQWMTTLAGVFRDLWERGQALGVAFRDLGVALAPVAATIGKIVLAVGAGIAIGAWVAFKAILDALTPTIEWLARLISEHQTATTILAGTILGVAAAYKTVQLAMAAYSAVTLAAKGIQQAFTAASYGSTAATYAQSTAQKIAAGIGRAYYGAIALGQAALNSTALATARATFATVAHTAAQKIAAAAAKVSAVAMRALGVAVRFATGPVGLIIAGIALLAAGLVYAYRNSETFRRIVDAAWAGIKAAALTVVDWFTKTALPALAAVWDGIKAGFGAVVDFFTGSGEGIKAGWTGIGEFFTGLWGGIKAGLQAVGQFFVTVWDGIKAGVQAAVDALVGIFLTWHPLGILISNWDQIKALLLTWGIWIASVFASAWGVLQIILLAPIRLALMGIQVAWAAITGAFMAAWTWISTVFLGLWGSLTTLLGGAMAAVQFGISAAWDWISARFMAAWTWIASVFIVLWSGLTGLIGSVMTSVQWAVSAAWDWITGRFIQAWTWVATVFMAWWSGLTGLIGSVLTGVRNAVGFAWDWITARFWQAWAWVTGVFMAAWSTLTWLIDGTLIAVRNAVGFAWQWITDRFWAAWAWVTTVFMGAWSTLTGLMRGPIDAAKGAIDGILGGIQGAFQFAVDAIRRIWDGIKNAVRDPIVIAVRIGNALVDGFNKVADFVKIPKAPTMQEPPGFKSGGMVNLPWQASNRDPYLGVTPKGSFRFEGEEFFVKRSSTRRLQRENPGALDYINRTGMLPGTDLPGFRDGGQVWPVPGWPQTRGAHGVDRGVDIAAPMGTPIVAARDALITAAPRLTTSYGTHFRTSAGEIYGHMSQQIARQGQQVRAGERIGLVGSTGNSTGPHLHYVGGGAGGFVGGIGSRIAGAAENIFGGFATVGEWMKSLTDKALGGLSALGDSPIGKVVGGLPRQIATGMLEKAKSIIPDLGGADPGGSGVERWRGTVMQALGMVGLPQTEAFVNAWLRQIKSESGGNPRAIQGIRDINSGGNEAAGLVQVIPGTFAAYRSKALPDDRLNPLASLFAGMNYAKSRYGSNMLGVIGRGHGYWQGTNRARPGLAIVGENGPEVVNMAGGEQVLNNSNSRRLINMDLRPIDEQQGASRDGVNVYMTGNFGHDPDAIARKAAHRLEQAMLVGGI